MATASYVDTKTQDQLGEVLLTEGWIAPPAAMKGLKMLPNGVAVGFKGNTVYMSEPNLPHAWPHQYPFNNDIIGLGVTRQGVVVITTGYPILLTGADPGAMSSERFDTPQAGVSKQAIVDTLDGTLYATPDGIWMIGSGGARSMTDKRMTATQWRAYNPSSMRFALHDSRLHVFYTTTGGTRGMLIFDFSGQGAELTTSDFSSDAAVTAAHVDPVTDTLYVAKGTNILRFNKGSPLTATWRTKKVRLPLPTNLGFAAVDATAYPVTLRTYAGGALKQTRTVTSADAFRLPGGFREQDWQFEMDITSGEVSRLRAASSIAELQQAQ